MKKNRFVYILISSLLFFACSSPLANTDLGAVREARNAKNSDILTLEVGAKDFCGTTEPNGEISYKVGSTYDIFFTENDEFQFYQWEVVNKDTGKKLSDVLSFEDKTKPETKITVLKSADNVLLRAVCKLRPKAISYFPEFQDEGVYCDSIIIINFDKKISESSFFYTNDELMFISYDSLLCNEEEKVYGYISNEQVYFKNVYITSSEDENLLKYFMPPVIENGTIVKIKPDYENLLLNENDSSIDIDVFITPDITDESGVSIGGEGVQWRYRINSNTDKEPPVFISFELAKAKKDFESIIGDLYVKGDDFSPINHVQNTVWYSCSGFDAGGGINFLQVESKRIQTADGMEVEEEPVIQIIPNSRFIKNEKADDSVSTGEIVSSIAVINIPNEEGLIELSFTLYDLSGNASKEPVKYLIAKDNSVDVSGCNFFNSVGIGIDESIDVQKLDERANTVCWTNLVNDVWQKDNFTPADDLSYTLYWGPEKGKLLNYVKCDKNVNFNNGVWSYTIPKLVKTNNTYLRLDVTDAMGNVASAESVIPATPKYYTYQKLSEEDVSPAHYRIYYTTSGTTALNDNNAFAGFLYYTYEDSEVLQTQDFLNVVYNEAEQTVDLKPSKYSDIYVDDISKCKFYFQLAYLSKQADNEENSEVKKELIQTVQKNVQDGTLYKEFASYDASLIAYYDQLKESDYPEAADDLLVKFGLWKYSQQYLQSVFYNDFILSPVNTFTIIEKKNIVVPKIESIKIERGEVNSSKNKATVTFDKEPPYGVVFNLFWGVTETDIDNFETESTFDIDSGITTLYYKTVYVDSFDGSTKTGEVFSYDLSDQNFDTIPPKVENYQCVGVYQNVDEYTACDFYPVITAEISYDNYEIIDNLAQYTLYSVPVDSPFVKFEDLSEDEITNSASVINTFVPSAIEEENVQIWNYIEGYSTSENYYYVLYVEDVEGNFSYTPLHFTRQFLENKPVITFEKNEENNLIDVTFTIEREKNCKSYQIEYSLFDMNLTPVTYVESTVENEKKKKSDDEDENIVNITVQAEEKAFYFGFAKALFQLKNIETYKYTYPVYFYTGLGDDVVCELKDVIDESNGAQIYCDRPCLVMTYWSSENYEYSIEKWETYGVQCNPEYISAKNPYTQEYEDTFKFYKLNKEEIPMGKYYVIIAHFADGTAIISKTINTN